MFRRLRAEKPLSPGNSFSSRSLIASIAPFPRKAVTRVEGYILTNLIIELELLLINRLRSIVLALQYSCLYLPNFVPNGHNKTVYIITGDLMDTVFRYFYQRIVVFCRNIINFNLCSMGLREVIFFVFGMGFHEMGVFFKR